MRPSEIQKLLDPSEPLFEIGVRVHAPWSIDHIFGKLEDLFGERLLEKRLQLHIDGEIYNDCDHSESNTTGEEYLSLFRPMRFNLYSSHEHSAICWSHFHRFASCPAILISGDSYTHLNHRRQGLMKLLREIKEHIARQMNIGRLVCTVNTQNDPEKRLLESSGWRHCSTFHNPNSGNTLEEWEKILSTGVEKK